MLCERNVSSRKTPVKEGVSGEMCLTSGGSSKTLVLNFNSVPGDIQHVPQLQWCSLLTEPRNQGFQEIYYLFTDKVHELSLLSFMLCLLRVLDFVGRPPTDTYFQPLVFKLIDLIRIECLIA